MKHLKYENIRQKGSLWPKTPIIVKTMSTSEHCDYPKNEEHIKKIIGTKK